MSGDPDRPWDDALTGFVWTVYDDTDAIVHMRHALFDPPEEASGDDTRTSLAACAGWLADAWPTVLGTRDDVIWAVMALPSDQLVAAGLTGVELEIKLLIWRRARMILDEVLREKGSSSTKLLPPTSRQRARSLNRNSEIRAVQEDKAGVLNDLAHAGARRHRAGKPRQTGQPR